MPNVIDRLQAEHDNLGRLVRLLDRHPAERAGSERAGIELLVDALYYLTHFPDVSHHPIEDRLVERLLYRNGLPAGFGAEIEAQHAVLARQGADLMRDLESAAREETMSWALVGPNVRLYAERLRHNMAVEELVLFPATLRHFGEEDWRAIEEAPGQAQPDPLFPAPGQARFVQLHRVIADEAQCGCEDEGTF
jgi:hemerythrin-like domain-containing protein